MNKRAIITGGSRGIGRSIALLLSAEGYDIGFTYRSNFQGAEETKQKILESKVRCYAVPMKNENHGETEAAIDSLIGQLGGVDLLVNNAAITQHFSIMNVTGSEMDMLYQVNLRSYLMATHVAVRHMVKHQIQGNVIFITSTHAMRAYAEDMLYGGFKAAIQRAAESMALDLSPYGIRVNCVAPGVISMSKDDPRNFNFIPLHRAGSPEEVAYLVSFLASDKAAYITGTTVKIDGGLILPGLAERLPNTRWMNPAWEQAQYESVINDTPAPYFGPPKHLDK